MALASIEPGLSGRRAEFIPTKPQDHDYKFLFRLMLVVPLRALHGKDFSLSFPHRLLKLFTVPAMCLPFPLLPAYDLPFLPALPARPIKIEAIAPVFLVFLGFVITLASLMAFLHNWSSE